MPPTSVWSTARSSRSRRGGELSKPRSAVDAACVRGLVFMTFHFAEEVDVNLLTIEANDPRSGTAEFKAAAVRIDKLVPV